MTPLNSTMLNNKIINNVTMKQPYVGVNLTDGQIEIVGQTNFNVHGNWPYDSWTTLNEYSAYDTAQFTLAVTNKNDSILLNGTYIVYDFVNGLVAYTTNGTTYSTSGTNEYHDYKSENGSIYCSDYTLSVHTLTDPISHCGNEQGDWAVIFSAKSGNITYIDIPYYARTLSARQTFNHWTIEVPEDNFPLVGQKVQDQYWFSMINNSQVVS